MDMNNISIEQKKEKGVIIGLLGTIIAIITMFLPYAKAGKESKSLVGIAKIYIASDSDLWGDKDYETFYKIFVPAILVLIVLFILVYLVKCLKKKPVGMIISNVLAIVAYEVLKWDFADRRVIPGACDKGMAFAIIYIAFGLMIVGCVMTVAEKRR